MSGINKVLLIGRLGKDPDVRYIPSGDCVCNFSVATSETWKDKQTGDKKEKTEWHNVVAWRQLGELCGKYLTRGSQCFVEGKLQTRSYEKDGTTFRTTEIIANEVQFLGGGQRNEKPSIERPPDPVGGDDNEDMIPF